MKKYPEWFIIGYLNEDGELVYSNSEDGMVYDWNDVVTKYQTMTGYKEIRAYYPDTDEFGEIISFTGTI